MTKSDFVDFDIKKDEDGWHAVGHGLAVSVVDGGEKAICHQRAIKKHLGTGETTRHSILRCELDGVKVYITGDSIVVTREKLHL